MQQQKARFIKWILPLFTLTLYVYLHAILIRIRNEGKKFLRNFEFANSGTRFQKKKKKKKKNRGKGEQKKERKDGWLTRKTKETRSKVKIPWYNGREE